MSARKRAYELGWAVDWPGMKGTDDENYSSRNAFGLHLDDLHEWDTRVRMAVQRAPERGSLPDVDADAAPPPQDADGHDAAANTDADPAHQHARLFDEHAYARISRAIFNAD